MRNDSDFPQQYKENLTIINRSGEYLLELIDDLSIDAIRIEILRLSQDVFEELKSATELSDMERLDQIVTKISFDHKALANELKKLVDSFQYDRILAFLDKI